MSKKRELPLLALVGRPNVGKSTLFNRIARKRLAIVNDLPGVTRDRKYSEAEWEGYCFRVVDTGGFEPETDNSVLKAMRRQTENAVEEADVIVFVTDGREGVMPQDLEVLEILRRTLKPVLVAINKVDGQRQEQEAVDFFQLGMEKMHWISAAHGRGVGDLLSDVVELLPDPPEMEYDEPEEPPRTEEDDKEEDAEQLRRRLGPPKIAVIGRPNAGKSTLINRILGEERLLALPEPGTTRDAVDVEVEWGGRKYVFVDTAGVRKQRKVKEAVEKMSVTQAWKALDQCEVAIMMVDATRGVEDQDTKIAGMAHNKGCGVIIFFNKWDQVDKTRRQTREFEKDARYELKYLSYAPMMFGSALTGSKLKRLFSDLDRVVHQARRRVPTGRLNRTLQQAVERHSPPTSRGRQVKFYYATQVSAGPPTFLVSTNLPGAVHFSYRRFLSNMIRKEFGFAGVPIKFVFRGKKGRNKRKGRRGR